ncbi:hypothetical protein BGX27_011331 [Mortierella sp. AM989]|nr:hypothetical protein BGX27_011331 [Mortierella sp. AM989]
MTNPDITANHKPSTMETIKDKATDFVHKVTGKSQDANDPMDPAHHNNHHNIDKNTTEHRHKDRTGPLHTGAAVAGAAVPHGNPIERTAYQQVAGAPGPATGHKDPNIHGTDTAASNPVAPGTVQHPMAPVAAAGPTGTSHIPTHSQNIPPTAASIFPTSHTAETVPGNAHGRAASGTAGTDAPINTNNSTVPVNEHNIHQTAPVHSNNAATATTNTVPAMGAPGTTTAAGTHVPGEYNPTDTSRKPHIPRRFDDSIDITGSYPFAK